MLWTTRWTNYIRRFDRVVWLLVGAVFIESFGRFLVDPYLTLFLVDKGVSLGRVGFVLAAAPLAGVLLGLVGGGLSDRFGRKPVQVFGVIASGLALVAFGFAGRNVVVLALLNFANGMSRALYRPAVQASIVDVTPPEMRAEAFGLRRVVLNVGAAIGPVVGLFLYRWIPSLGFWIAGGMSLVVGLYFAVAVPETRPRAVRAARPGGHATATNPSSEWRVWSRIMGDGILWTWIFGTAITAGIYRLIDTYLPVHLGLQHVPTWVYATLLPINAIICVVAQLPLNYWLRRANIGLVMLVAAVPYALGFLGFGYMRAAGLVILSLVLFTLGEVLQASAQPRFIPELAPVDLRGRYMGLSGLQDLGRTVMPIVGGFAMARWGGHTVFVAAAILALVAGAVTWGADLARVARGPVDGPAVPAARPGEAEAAG